MTRAMVPGERAPIAALTAKRTIEIVVEHSPSDIDIAAFGLGADGRIGDDRYVVLFSNRRSPEGAIGIDPQAGRSVLTIALDALPASIARIAITAAHDTLALGRARLSARVADAVTIEATGLSDERAVTLLDLYRHGSDWRVAAVVQGFAEGLAALVRHLGGEVAEDAPPPALPVSLSKVDLRKQQVGVTLAKLGIDGVRAEVLLVIDASGSMARLFADGTVQETVERIVPVALRLDDDGRLDTWFYAAKCRQVDPLDAGNVEGFVARTLPYPGAKVAGGPGIGAGNNEPLVMEAILAREPARRTQPLLILFLTDGGISGSKSEAIKDLLRRTSDRAIFWQYVGIGRAGYGILRDLDTIDGRLVDNAGFFAVDDLAQIGDEELYQRLLGEFPAWLKAARAAGVLA
ncbi:MULTISPECIES: VWA domain-containing protein [unclassified Sphingomonas]|uniref:VWA domain-containing protein n=1 Tax=unclassified Sphingomonas TaxID=196159 RepID=UPI000AB56491|nr:MULTISPECIES: VWA domain-containing protein [unclassified Sphingomonas]